ncbi:MAG: MFS transporter [Patescibacteria group bacterium]
MQTSKALPIFVANFFFSIHFAATLYINSSFLGHFFSPSMVGWLYAFGALGNVFFFLNAERILHSLGSRGFLLFFSIATLISTIGAAVAVTPTLAIVSFLVYSSVSMMIYYSFDILLEEISNDSSTGKIRGIYLTITNAAIMGGPILVALAGDRNNFSDLYFVSAFFLVPIFLLMIFSLRSNKKGGRYLSLPLPFNTWLKLKNVRGVTIARGVLEFFFAVMVIYLPIYLRLTIGFDWREIGIIFAFMLLPFVLFEWPAGELADKKYGEKEIMAFGFVTLGLSVLIMPFLGKTFLLWAIVLFVSRIGASLIEITTDSYFFKHIGSSNVGFISIFRLARPVGLIAGAVIGAITMATLPHSGIFLALAIVIFFGLRQSLRLVDTK